MIDLNPIVKISRSFENDMPKPRWDDNVTRLSNIYLSETNRIW